MSDMKDTRTIGEQRVRVNFNPSEDKLVDDIKLKTARLIDICNGMIDGTQEKTRAAACAMTYYEMAAMWAVKAATTDK
jgi:hypothetical protein